MLLWPPEPLIEEFLSIREEVWRRNGGNSRLGRQLSALLRHVEFKQIQATASYWVLTEFKSQEPLPSGNCGEFLAAMASSGEVGKQMVEYGLADQDWLEQYVSACKQWGQHPDAYFGYSGCEAVGWKE